LEKCRVPNSRLSLFVEAEKTQTQLELGYYTRAVREALSRVIS